MIDRQVAGLDGLTLGTPEAANELFKCEKKIKADQRTLTNEVRLIKDAAHAAAWKDKIRKVDEQVAHVRRQLKEKQDQIELCVALSCSVGTPEGL